MPTWNPAVVEPYQPQAALERAVVTILQTSENATPAGLGWTARECGRTYDGRPMPNMGGEWFAAVWHDGSRQAGPNVATCLEEDHGVYVTVTVRTNRIPFDRWHEHLRDQLEYRVNQVRALLGRDTYNNRVINAANALADFRSAGHPGGSYRVGFTGLWLWQGDDPIQEVGPEWFHARLDQTDICGLAQRVKFGGIKRIQAWSTVGY